MQQMSGFVHRIPFFRLFLALAGGVLLASVIHVAYSLLAVVGALSIGMMLTTFVFKDSVVQFQQRWLFGGGALLFFMVIGCGLFQYQQDQITFPFNGFQGGYCVRIKEAPIEKSKSTLYKVDVESVFKNGEMLNVDKVALLYLPKDSSGARFEVDDKLLVYAKFSMPKPNGNPEEFDFGRYLQLHGISATAYAANGTFKKIGHETIFSLKTISSRVRLHLLDIYRKCHIEGDEFAVLAALMLGYNDALTRELMDSYSVTGAMHILSVSGLHVAIICAVFYFLFSFMDKKRGLFVAKHLLVILLLWGFAFLTGLGPAVVRSSLMFSLIAFGYVVSRKPQIYNTLFFSAFIMLLYSPAYLFDVGFQLSYLAVLSIVYFEPKFRKLIVVRSKPLKWLWGLICVSFAAQLGTAALGIFYFHKFANFFWLSNIIIVPLSGFVMYAAMALLAVSPIGFIADWVALSLKWLLVVMNGIVRWIEHLPMAAYTMWIDQWQLLFVSAAILFLAAYFTSKRFAFLMVAGLCVVMFQVQEIVRLYQVLQQKEMIVWADTRNTHVQFSVGGNTKIMSSDTARIIRLSAAYTIKHRLEHVLFSPELAVSFGGQHFLITNDTLFRRKHTSLRLKVDYLIVGNKTRITMKKMLSFVAPRAVIIDNSISSWYSKHIKAECDSLHIACVDTKTEGAFRLRLN